MNIVDFKKRYPDFVGYIDDAGHPCGFASRYLHSVQDITDPADEIMIEQQLIAFWRGLIIIVHIGYVSDGASIPRIFWRVVGHPFGKYLPAAVVHDALYETEMLDRKEADQCFRDLIKALPVSTWRRALMYRAVRLGGGARWNKHTPESIATAMHYLTVGELNLSQQED